MLNDQCPVRNAAGPKRGFRKSGTTKKRRAAAAPMKSEKQRHRPHETKLVSPSGPWRESHQNAVTLRHRGRGSDGEECGRTEIGGPPRVPLNPRYILPRSSLQPP